MSSMWRVAVIPPLLVAISASSSAQYAAPQASTVAAVAYSAPAVGNSLSEWRNLRQSSGYTAAVEKSLTEVLQLNINVDVSGRLFFTLDRSPIEQLRAELSTPDRALTIRRGEDGELLLDGILSILQGSKYIFIKTFDAGRKKRGLIHGVRHE